MFAATALKLLAVPILAATHVLAAQNSLQQVFNFGTNPSNIALHVYRPTGLVANPALIVALHPCGGSGPGWFSQTRYADLSDSLKTFLVIYPSSPPNSNGCWEVYSNATFTHNGGSDSLGVASAIKYSLSTYSADPARVFLTGFSSGAMMTSVMAGAYPDLFAAGSAFSGVPYACFSESTMINNPCATGRVSKTPQEWGDLVRRGYPGYTGPRPKIQLWHGLQDEVVNYNNQLEGIKQWTNVLGYSTTPISTQTNDPLSGWTRSIYGPNFQAISAPATHGIPIQENEVLKWFGLVGGSPGTGTTTTTRPPSTTTTYPPEQPTQVQYGQCGGYASMFVIII
ncbi:Feruloyl esterase B [Psilocybe cubensis]|uniref:Feruloyl esterase B n=1 Tax=Psilocybe cubensis TaxID=181762 RepID=A0ACB8HAX1_PSICU|nr:Feruloyl esterase B [Psilocybe cubensis]KAH9484829.1 Feruloyl esterase B [Psilocybe cubensis]